MVDPAPGPAIASIKLGPDVVVRTEDGIEVYTPLPMVDWIVSPHRPTVIHFHGEDFLLVDQRAPEDGGICYVLRRGDPDAALNVVGRTIVYDLGAVRERERERIDRTVLQARACALWALSPLLGLAPSRAKSELHSRFGLHPLTLTWASVVVEYAVALVGALALVLETTTGGGLTKLGGGWVLPIFGGASLVLLPDALGRTGRLIGGGLRQYGFYEWLWRRLPARD
ncbi:MAG: hypothetical protein JXR83_03850 [Deltaproteobacteria bacterium]|nr:hypothetical protein [Deltaproteobacteria bacterium]